MDKIAKKMTVLFTLCLCSSLLDTVLHPYITATLNIAFKCVAAASVSCFVLEC